MGSRDDLAQLLVPAGGSDFGFHTGEVISWDDETGSNSVDVAGSVLGDVPILNTSEAIALQAGDVVGLLRFRHSYFILGRITVPGASSFSPSAVVLETLDGDSSDFSVNGSWAKKGVETVAVPAWATEAVVSVQSIFYAANTAASPSAVECRSRVESDVGASRWGAWSPVTVLDGHVISLSAQLVARFDADTIGTQLEVSTEVERDSTGVNLPASTYTRVQTSALVIFRRA